MTENNNNAKEKKSAAIQSVFASIGLTIFKLVVGLLTNSLGILAEAAHSGLDLVAALMTTFAVHVADQPPDPEHPFGHGKVENLSALFETLLLVGTAIWIIYEAVQRLFFHPETVKGSIWAFIIMGVSIVVDIDRSRMLYRAAEKHNSQALEADALHFRTDIWSSSVVLVGLVGIKLAEFVPGLDWMVQADAVAALVVALIVLAVSWQMGNKAVQALLDRAPQGLESKIITQVENVEGVLDCHRIRIRGSGAGWFVDLHITLEDPGMPLEKSHGITELVEVAVQELLPDADVIVHVEPPDPAGSPPSK